MFDLDRRVRSGTVSNPQAYLCIRYSCGLRNDMTNDVPARVGVVPGFVRTFRRTGTLQILTVEVSTRPVPCVTGRCAHQFQFSQRPVLALMAPCTALACNLYNSHIRPLTLPTSRLAHVIARSKRNTKLALGWRPSTQLNAQLIDFN